MKLKKLTIHNIASVEDAVIDFEHGPLAEDSRFLICGPTGSGKTTLLDSICLVLYGTTPRLSVPKSEGYTDAEEKYGGRQDVSIGDTRMLMRRGSLNAFVELIFTDKNDRILKASWECSRAHNKITGSIKDPVWKIADAEDNVISVKKKEIKNFIEESIGLTFEQFCRTTMLAQGDFTRFLKSDEDSKSQILEKLTGTDIYTEISCQIHLIKKEKEDVCSQIRNRLEGVRLLTEEERNEILQRQDFLKQKAAHLSEEEKHITEIVSWIENSQKLEKRYVQVCADYEEKHKRIETEEFMRDRKLVADWDRTALQRENMKNRIQAQRLMTERKEHEKLLKSRYITLLAGLLHLHNEEQQYRADKSKIEIFLKSEEPKSESYRQVNLIQSLVQQYGQAMSQITRTRENIESKNKEIAELENSKLQQTDKVQRCNERVEIVTKELAAITDDLCKMDYDGLLSSQAAVIKESADLKEYAALVESCIQSDELLKKKEKELSETSKNILSYKEDAEKIEKEEKNIEEQLERQQKIYDRQKLSCEDIIKEYRSHLSDGDTCPLCGQKIHGLASDEHFMSVLQPVKECLDELKKQQSDVSRRMSDMKAVIIQASKTKQTQLQEFYDAETKYKEILRRKQANVMHNEYQTSENPTDAINERLTLVSRYIEEIKIKLNKVGELQKKVSDKQKEKEMAEKILHQEENILKDIDSRQNVARSFISSEQERKETLSATLSDTETKMSQYISIDSYKKEGSAYIVALNSAAEKYQKAEQQLQVTESKLQQIDSELKHICELKYKIEEKHAEWKNVEDVSPKNIPEVSSLWISLHADVMKNAEVLVQAETSYNDAGAALKDYYNQEGALSEAELSDLYMHQSSEIETVRRNLQNLRDRELAARTEKTTIEQSIKEMHDRRPEMEEGITYDAANALLQSKKNEISELNQQLGQNKQNLDNDSNNRKRYAEITSQLEKAEKEFNEWSELHELFGSADGKKFRNIAQSYVLEQLLVNSNQYLRQFSDRYEMICQPGSLTILLRDNEAGGATRPTTTMSGGESFLLSLSLALGLSSLSRASFSVDTLFIDEGFGTLDSTYLSCVMDALERLHQMGGKKIGIISHVESLKERLTTQIQVSRINSTLSRVEVVSTL